MLEPSRRRKQFRQVATKAKAPPESLFKLLPGPYSESQIDPLECRDRIRSNHVQAKAAKEDVSSNLGYDDDDDNDDNDDNDNDDDDINANDNDNDEYSDNDDDCLR